MNVYIASVHLDLIALHFSQICTSNTRILLALTMSDKHKSVTSSTYSGKSASVNTAAEQTVTKIDQYNMKKSTESYKEKRRQNQAEAKARREEEEKARKA